MNIPRAPHAWNVTPKRAIEIQRSLADAVMCRGSVRSLHLAAGADLAFSAGGKECIAGVVLWDIREQCVLEQYVIRRPVRFPYVPGLLSFREAPAVAAALRKLRREPDVFLFDGQGYAHPRRFGLACHVGLWLNRPSIGCAKSILVGSCDDPASKKGAQTPLVHKDERIGLALRTRDGVKPVYVSVGHKLSLASAATIVLECCTKYRLPEPTRLADQLVAKAKRGERGMHSSPARSRSEL